MRPSSTRDCYQQAGSKVEVELILDIKACLEIQTHMGVKKNPKSLSGSTRTWVKSDRVMSPVRPGLQGKTGGLKDGHERLSVPAPPALQSESRNVLPHYCIKAERSKHQSSIKRNIIILQQS